MHDNKNLFALRGTRESLAESDLSGFPPMEARQESVGHNDARRRPEDGDDNDDIIKDYRRIKARSRASALLW